MHNQQRPPKNRRHINASANGEQSSEILTQPTHPPNEPEGFPLTRMLCSRTACALGADLSLDTWGALASFKIAFYTVYKIDR